MSQGNEVQLVEAQPLLAEPSAFNPELIYGLDDRPPLRETIFVALQHVFAVFVGIITPPLIIGNTLKLDAVNTAFIVSMSLFISGVSTFIQARRIGPIGSGLLSIQGTSFAFLGPILATAGGHIASGKSQTEALGIIFGLCFFGSFVSMILSRFLHLASKVITPLVTGTVVTLIGLTLIEVGITSVGGGFDAKQNGTFGSPQNLFLAGLVIAIIVILNNSRIAYLRMTSIVVGLAVGYLVALSMGRVDLSRIGGLSLFTVPFPFHYGFGFDSTAMIPFAFLYVVTTIETIGDVTATSTLTNQPIRGTTYVRRIKGAVLADGVNSCLAAIFNTFPNTTFAQNNGVIQLTGVGSRYVGYFIAAILILLGLVPIVGGVFQAMPQPVLGGATIIMFGTVAVAGIRILSEINLTKRSSIIMAVSLGLGLGVTYVPEILHSMPNLIKNTLSSGIATGGMCALFLNIVLPGQRD